MAQVATGREGWTVAPFQEMVGIHPETGAIHCLRYIEGPDAFVAEVTRPDKTEWGVEGNHTIAGTPERYSLSSPTVQKAIQAMREGDPELSQRITDMAKLLVEEVNFETRTWRYEGIHYDVAGDEVEIGRFCSGEPENMMQYQPVLRKGGNIVTIACNVGTLKCEEVKEQIAMRGAAICALVDLLENQGYRVELAICDAGRLKIANSNTYVGHGYTAYNSGLIQRMEQNPELYHMYGYRMAFKRPNDPVDVDRMAFCLMSRHMPSTLWGRLGNLQSEQIRQEWGFLDGGLGGASDEVVRFMCRDADIFLGSEDVYQMDSEENAIQWIRSLLSAVESNHAPIAPM